MKRGREFGGPGESNNDGKQRDFCCGLKLAKARDVCLRILVIFLKFVLCTMLFLCFDLQIQCCIFHRLQIIFPIVGTFAGLDLFLFCSVEMPTRVLPCRDTNFHGQMAGNFHG